jgi:alanine-synthesizing transaminase
MSRWRPVSVSANTAMTIALVENEQRIRQAARNIRRFLETGVDKLHNVVPLANRR